MEYMYRQVKAMLGELEKMIPAETFDPGNIEYLPCGYKESNTPPEEGFLPFENGCRWGTGNDSHAWFRFSIDLPDGMKNDPTAALRVTTDRSGWDARNPQFICYINGVMRQGVDTNHREVLLNLPGEERSSFDVLLYAYTGPHIPDASLSVSVVTKHPEVEKLWYDISVPARALDCTEKNTREYMSTLTALSRAVGIVDFLEPRGEAFFESVKAADDWLQKNFYGRCSGNGTSVICIGHTHIDVAWLWTVKQTREKAQRSFATVVELMKRYPEYRFMSSQAYLYKAVKEEAPELYEEIKKMVAAGRWEVEGAMWLEADCNLPSGESLVRQIVYGKRFFKNEFGVDSRVLWLPDVFGYSAALPQILKKTGVDWFVTSKISWNDTDIMPYDLFRWRGIDGTAVSTYFLTAQKKDRGTSFSKFTTYNSDTTPDYIAGTYNRFQQKDLSDEALVSFGYGDGGGGPTNVMLENLRRQKDGLPGQPKAVIGFAGDFLKRLEKKMEEADRVPEWRGELYLEFHRGTYTSNAKNKKNNRRSEQLLQQAELVSTGAEILLGTPFPSDELSGAWETVLTDQFHDIIPGSSIREVYEDTDRDYAGIFATAEKITGERLSAIASAVETDKKYVVFNPHSFEGKGIVKAEGKTFAVSGIPPKGYKAVDLSDDGCSVRAEREGEGFIFESPFWTVRFDGSAEIVSLYDVENRLEVIAPGEKGNSLRIYEDYPDKYDAWEIVEYSGYKYITVGSPESAEIVSDGARRGLRTLKRHGDSEIVQTVWFYDSIRRIDFETRLDWHGKHRILRAAFPVAVNSDRASFEIQFGYTERPTHFNTSWDRMKFETCGHKFADLSEGGYGVSLLNDCKYGYNVHGNTMMLTLLRCPEYPNEVADEGIHEFTYSLLPHAGTLQDSDTVREGYMLNLPMAAISRPAEVRPSGIRLPESWSAVRVDADNVIADTVKKAEDGDGIIIRLYESLNKRCRTSVTLGFEAESVESCDLLENPEKPVAIESKDGRTTFGIDVSPFEIITLKVKRPC